MREVLDSLSYGFTQLLSRVTYSNGVPSRVIAILLRDCIWRAYDTMMSRLDHIVRPDLKHIACVRPN